MKIYPPQPASSETVEDVLARAPEETGTRAAARAALDGHRKGLLALLPFLGPAFIASVAYVDPGNFATNIQSGSAYGYNLLWIIALANLMAMLLQTMSAKLGLATGHNQPRCAASISANRSHTGCGSRRRSGRWRPTSPSFSEPALLSTSCLGSPCCTRPSLLAS